MLSSSWKMIRARGNHLCLKVLLEEIFFLVDLVIFCLLWSFLWRSDLVYNVLIKSVFSKRKEMLMILINIENEIYNKLNSMSWFLNKSLFSKVLVFQCPFWCNLCRLRCYSFVRENLKKLSVGFVNEIWIIYWFYW